MNPDGPRIWLAAEHGARPRPQHRVPGDPAPQRHLGDPARDGVTVVRVVELTAESGHRREADGPVVDLDLEVLPTARLGARSPLSCHHRARLSLSMARLGDAVAVRDDPFGAFNFLVKLGDAGGEDRVSGGFSDVSGLGSEIQYAEYRNGNDLNKHPRKIATTSRTNDVVLRRGLIGDL